MKSLLIGNGAREHAIAEKMAESSTLFAYMGANNPGITKLSQKTAIGKPDDFDSVLKFAMHIEPDYVFIGPEGPLAKGLADVLEKEGVPVVGPGKAASKLEADKSFCRELMQNYVKEGYPKFAVCSTRKELLSSLNEFDTDVVVKPAGLTGGKGVKVQGQHLKDLYEVREYALEVIEKEIGGSSTVVIEEKLIGEEFTLQAFTDGTSIAAMPIVQDHKYAYEGDVGPMTGGMGSYSDSNHLLPFLKENDKEDALRIMHKTINALNESTGALYKGVLYGQFMLTSEGPKIIEYNVRFGDPEAMNVLPILKTDFSQICMSILDDNLSEKIEFENKATVCKYLVPKGYPGEPESGAKVDISESVITEKGAQLYYASVDEREDGIYTSTSRSFGIVGLSDSIDHAEEISENAISTVKSDKLFYRTDIGKRDLVEQRVRHMEELRGA